MVAPSESRAQAITRQQGDAILKELREIRQLLEQLLRTNPPRRAPNPAPPAKVKIDAGHAYALGRAEAPLTLIEFTDYQCPFCQRFHSEVFEQLKKNYVDTGKLRFISRDLPLGFHPNALRAARAARCAGDQGKFWEMRNVLVSNAKDLTPEAIAKYAQGVGLEMRAFRACVASDKFMDQIEQDVAEADALEITGTPTFVLGKTASDKMEGTRIVGVRPYAFFEARINELLGK